jgi:membrane-associated phospholipid phosphatase
MRGRRVGVLAVLLVCVHISPAVAQNLAQSKDTGSRLPASVFTQDAPQAPAATPVPAATPNDSFLTSLGQDVIHLASAKNALILGIGGALAFAASPADARITRSAAANEPFEETLDGGATVGSGWVQGGAALGTLIVGHLVSNQRAQEVGSELIRAQIVNTAITQGLKYAVDRTRPDGTARSFPSGHASASFATAAVLQQQFGWKVGLAAYGAAAYASTSRLSENRHYASDIIFGAALGIVCGRTVSIGHGENRFAVMPVAVPGGAAVTFSRIRTR